LCRIDELLNLLDGENNGITGGDREINPSWAVAIPANTRRPCAVMATARQSVRDPRIQWVLKVGAALSICTYVLPNVMKAYCEANPKVLVILRSGNSAQVLKMVLDGEVDLGIARSLTHPEVKTTTLSEDPLILIGHHKHSRVSKRKMTLAEAETLPLIL
jgi:DNA-binding transcriptional LysR family regulator